MRKEYHLIKLGRGEVRLYRLGKTTIHNYITHDEMNDQVIVVEQDGRAVVIEQPSFIANAQELSDYLARLGLKVVGKLVAYHLIGMHFLPEVPLYTTQKADDYGRKGGGLALAEGFRQLFGKSFDGDFLPTEHYLREGTVNLEGIKLRIFPTVEAFDIEIPAARALYTHMLGHDAHSIVAGAEACAAMIRQLETYHRKHYDLILSSHHTPESDADLMSKIEYLRHLKQLAAQAHDEEEFKTSMRHHYPDFAGEDYLNMTAGFYFPKDAV